MTRRKNFFVGLYPRDLLVDIKGLSADAGFAYIKFWMHHHLHGEPLPAADEQVDDQDEYFRDLLDMKNVRTWRRVLDELLKRAKIRRAADGRLYMARVMRDLGRSIEPAPEEPQLPLDPPSTPVAPAPRSVERSGDKCVDSAGQAAGSTEVRSNIERSSGEVRPNIDRSSPDVGAQVIDITTKSVRPSYSYSESNSESHEGVAVRTRYPRARGDPPP